MKTANYNVWLCPTVKPKAETLLAMQETERIIEEYESGKRTHRPFSNARDMFDAMDLEDEAERVDV